MNNVRESIQKKDAVWLFAGGPMQEPMAKTIKARGFSLLLTDFNEDCFCRSLADEFVHLDTFAIEKNISAGEKLSLSYNIKAVVTSGADCHETVASVAKSLGLHGIDPNISRACRQKQITRDILTRAGIPQPEFIVASSFLEAKEAVCKIGYPCAIKATNNSGSRGFSKISTPDDLTEEIFNVAIESGTTGMVIIEELLIPVSGEIAEQSVETVWYDGKMYWLNWVDRLFREDTVLFTDINKHFDKKSYWGVELAHINPAMHDQSTKEQVKEMIYKSGCALGLNQLGGGHIFKADIMLTTKGPYILEVTPRLSGGWDSSATTPARGADFVGGALSLALGEDLTLENWHKYFEYRMPNIYSSVFALPKEDRKDCIGRKFSIGQSFSREESLKLALDHLIKGEYLPE